MNISIRKSYYMNTYRKKFLLNRGFTLLELLVVIAIIGMLTSFIFVQMTGFRANSRDATREESIKQIQNGLDLYHVTHLRYPICAEVIINGSNDCLSSALVNDGVFNSVPVDPLGGGTGVLPCGDSNPNLFEFCYESATGSDYIIQYNLETNTIQGKDAEWQTVLP